MIKKKTASLIDDNYSSYWLDDSTGVFSSESDNSSDIERTVKLAAIRRAVANFVRILTNDAKIEVKFSSGKESYTDGKTVVIAADDNPEHFDSMVGLALHEGSHCLLSDFNFLKTINLNSSAFYGALHPTLRNNLYGKISTDTIRNYLKLLMNIIEDRRIDSYVYRWAPGYRPYYDAMYKKYFFNNDVEKNLKHNPEWRIPTVENYINWLLLMFSPHFTPRALPGLNKMVKMIDLQNIRKYDNHYISADVDKWVVSHKENNNSTYIYEYTQFSPLWKIANELLIEILKYSKKYADSNNIPFTIQEVLQDVPVQLDMDGQLDLLDEEDNELENLDVATGRFNSDKGNKALKKIRESVTGNIKKKKLTRVQQQQIESMESASAKIEENNDRIMGKIPCLVTRKFSKEILNSTWFPFSRNWGGINNYAPSTKGVIDGIRMGQILTHRLQVRNDPTITHFTRQPHGKIDRRILAQLGMEIETVFKRTTVENFRPAMLHLSLDASGSMCGDKWAKVMTVATALAYTATKIRNLDVVITLRGNIESGTPIVSVVFDSRVDTFHKVRQLFPFLMPTGATPEGLCFAATLDLIQECASTHSVFFINFSDGEPSCTYKHNNQNVAYHGWTAIEQTKLVVNKIRETGVRIMSYFITEGNFNPRLKEGFIQMYGQNAEFVNVKNVTQVIKTLNKLLLIRD